MSYLSQPTSTTNYGVVLVGNNVNVLDGVISLDQGVSPTSDVTFNTITSTGDITSAGKSVVTTVTPTAGSGINISSLVSTGPSTSWTVNNTGVLSITTNTGLSTNVSATGDVTVTNTGVLSLTAGSGISLSGSTGDITISSFGADLINVIGVTSNYTATLTDEYIGVSSASAVTITLPTGVDGRVYTIKDEFGQGSGKITVQPPSGILIDKKTNYIISVPNQSIQIVYRAGGWWII